MPPHDTLPPAGTRLDQIEQQWDAWRPDQVAQRLRAVTAPWYVAGGWALDLHRAEQARGHHDLEIGVPAAAFGQILEALADCEFEAVGSGQLWPADSPALARTHQTWVSEPDPDRVRGRVYRLDVFREPERAGQWVYRRDEQIVLPYDRVIGRGAAGIPYLMPEIVLLFKAKQPRQKDEADFAAALPLLAPPARAWLRHTLDRVHPGHAWIGAL
jgi:hypothetical protein